MTDPTPGIDEQERIEKRLEKVLGNPYLTRDDKERIKAVIDRYDYIATMLEGDTPREQLAVYVRGLCTLKHKDGEAVVNAYRTLVEKERAEKRELADRLREVENLLDDGVGWGDDQADEWWQATLRRILSPQEER